MSRPPCFAANWKMYKTPHEAREYARTFSAAAERVSTRCAIALCAPYVDLEALGAALEGTRVLLGAQNCFFEPGGPFTGEVSAAMLASVGVRYCIVGHSERRRLFGETDEVVARKVSALIGEGIRPIVCVGETLEENRAGETRRRVAAQVHTSLQHLTEEQRAGAIIAYEPIWAIGTGLADSPETSNATIGYIRAALGGLDRATVLYGGSMKADNAAAFCAQPNIDGGLVGSASLDPAGFLTLIENGMRGIDAAGG
jgi:triosephosphate isomerase (TIM)